MGPSFQWTLFRGVGWVLSAQEFRSPLEVLFKIRRELRIKSLVSWTGFSSADPVLCALSRLSEGE